jgi:hypothetical protein
VRVFAGRANLLEHLTAFRSPSQPPRALGSWVSPELEGEVSDSDQCCCEVRAGRAQGVLAPSLGLSACLLTLDEERQHACQHGTDHDADEREPPTHSVPHGICQIGRWKAHPLDGCWPS